MQTMGLKSLALGLFFSFFLALILHAHEFRPAHLKLISQKEGGIQVVFKQPVLNDGRSLTRGMNLSVVLPDHCQVQKLAFIKEEVFWLERFYTPCDLMGSTDVITIKNLDCFATDVFVEVFDGDVLRTQSLLNSKKTDFSLLKPHYSFFYYFQLGIKHLLTGMDHVLFLLGVLLVLMMGYNTNPKKKDASMKRLFVHSFGLITVFSLAHGISLLVSVYGVIKLPRLSIEAIIALSLVFLASQQLKNNGYALKALSASVFVFGVVHGFGFSGALLDIGFNASSQVLAILLFNVGIELGQIILGLPLLFIFLVLLYKKEIRFFFFHKMAFYAIGSLGLFFFLKRFFLIVMA